MKKMLLLASMALAAVALAVPATASAQEWLHNEVPTESGEETLSGNVRFNSNEGLGGIGCNPAHVTIEITGATTGEVTKYNCTNPSTFGALKELFGCEIEGGPEYTVPYTMHVIAAGSVEYTKTVVHYRMNSGCLAGEEIDILDGNVIATLTNPTKFTSAHLSGTVLTEVGEAETEGTLTPTKSTYGIG